jgi:hypothetical protein
VSEDDTPVIWQPVMLVAEKRIECGACSAKAIFIILDGAPDDIKEWDFTAWCQHCFEREQAEVENERR